MTNYFSPINWCSVLIADKNGVNDMRRLFLQLKADGKTMIIASHNSVDI